MISVLLPYTLGLLAVVAVLAFYLRVTGEVATNAATAAEEKAVQISWELSRLASDSTMAALMFMSYSQDDMLFRRLKPDFTNLLGLDDFTFVVPMAGAFSRLPFGRDTLAERAVVSGELQLRWNEGEEAGELTVFFPAVVDSGTVRWLSRMKLPASTESISFDRYRYMFFILAAAVIVLIIGPAVVLRMADLRRRTDLTRFSSPEIARQRGAAPSREPLRNDPMLSSFLSEHGAPALFRLDTQGSILDMSPSALELLDISSEAASGMMFHRLPGLIAGGGLECYPDEWRSGSFVVALEDRSGKVREIRFTAESLGDEGYLLAGRSEGDQPNDRWSVEARESGRRSGAEQPDPGTVQFSTADMEQIRRLAEEGRESVAPGSDAAVSFDRIRALATPDGAEPALCCSSGHGIEICSELDRIALALNDVLPERAMVEVDSPGFLPEVRFTRQDLTQFIKNMVFYSLESVQGQVRIRFSAREVSSPVTDSVFSARCDRSVGGSVSLSYTDGARMPVRLKEALLDPETDSSGIRRDFGNYVTAAAAILSDRNCYPVFTEGTLGTKLHILFPTCDNPQFESADRGAALLSVAGEGMSVVICDASKAVRDSVSEAVGGMGVDALSAADIEELLGILDTRAVSGVVLDASVLESNPEPFLQSLREKYPGTGLVIATRPSQPLVPAGSGMDGLSVLLKPYTPLELMEALAGVTGSMTAGHRAG